MIAKVMEHESKRCGNQCIKSEVGRDSPISAGEVVTQSADDHIEKTACAGNSGDELSAGDRWWCVLSPMWSILFHFGSSSIRINSFQPDRSSPRTPILLQHEWATSKHTQRFPATTVPKGIKETFSEGGISTTEIGAKKSIEAL